MKKILKLLLVSIVLISCQDQQTALTLNLKKGETYRQVIRSKSTITQEIGGQQMEMKMNLDGGMSFKVLAVNSTDYDLEVKYESLSMTMEMPQGIMEFSSDKNDENDIFSTLLSKMIGITFNVKMASTGKILEVKNIERRLEALFDDYSHIPENQLAQLKTQLTKAYGAKAFKGNIEMVTAIFPDIPVYKGDKWTVITNLESGMSGIMTSDYQFIGLNSSYILINGNSIIETADKDAYIESNGMPMKYDMKGSMISEIKVDKVSGWIIEADIKQEIKGDAYIKENPRMPNGMKVYMTMINNMTVNNK